MKISNVKIVDLVEAEYNPRTLSKKEHQQIQVSLEEFGFVSPILLNTHKDRKNVIIGGHQRVKVWLSMGNDSVPAVKVSLDLKKEKELNVRLNKNTGSWDYDKLEEFFDLSDLGDFGFEEYATNEPVEDLSYDPDLSPEANNKPVTAVDIERATEQQGNYDKNVATRDCICPACGHEYQIEN